MFFSNFPWLRLGTASAAACAMTSFLRILTGVSLLGGALAVGACGDDDSDSGSDAPSGLSGDIKIDGSSTYRPMIKRLLGASAFGGFSTSDVTRTRSASSVGSKST